jgi:hypothetical protein
MHIITSSPPGPATAKVGPTLGRTEGVLKCCGGSSTFDHRRRKFPGDEARRHTGPPAFAASEARGLVPSPDLYILHQGQGAKVQG